MKTNPSSESQVSSVSGGEPQTLARSVYELTENMPAGTYVLTLTPRDDGNADLAFRFVSKRFLEIFGLAREIVLHDPNAVLTAIHPDDLDSMNEANSRALATAQPFRWEGRLRVDGITKWYNISSNPRVAADGVTVWEGVVSDITPRVDAERRLSEALGVERQLRADAVKAYEKKSLFLANVSHEIRTPLSALVALSQVMWLRCESSVTDPEITRFLNRVRSGGQYLNLLLRNMLDASAAESGRVPVRRTSFYLADWTDEVRNIVEPIADYHRGRLEWILPEDDEIRLHTDEMRLTQIFLNLAENALKFSQGADEPVVIRLEKRHDMLGLSVEDRGPGIPHERLDSVFAEFEQADAVSLPLVSGVGLGLSVVKLNISLLNGSLSVEPRPGGGMRFAVEIPAAEGSTP